VPSPIDQGGHHGQYRRKQPGGVSRSRDRRHESRGRDAARSDVDRAKSFYQSLGWRLDADIVRGGAFRVVQLTPPDSSCSIAFGKGVTSGEPGSVQRLILVVSDIDAARADLASRSIEVSEIFHLDGGRVPGPDPEGRSYQTYASFSDPDGNGWLLQQITARRPGREW
jgi:catechol 2,3-dioxygenase-like lactoylglutathione lyase family enzyme